MHRSFEKLRQKKEALSTKRKQQLGKPPVHQRAAFFRRCGKRKR
ncbi:hypothetical protein [Lacrimispora sp.]